MMAEHEKAAAAGRRLQQAQAERQPASVEAALAEQELEGLRFRLAHVEAESERRRAEAAGQRAKAQNLSGQVHIPAPYDLSHMSRDICC